MTAPEAGWATGTLVSFDTETSGRDPGAARIVAASVVVIDGTTGHVRDHGELASAVIREVTAHARS